MASVYRPADDNVWRELHATADNEVADADERIADRCRQLGIPETFRPRLQLLWHSRGENAAANRRTELRAVAKTRIDADKKTATTEIERRSIDIQEQLIAGGFETDEARAFLTSMPTADALMPAAPSLAEIEAQHGTSQQRALTTSSLTYGELFGA